MNSEIVLLTYVYTLLPACRASGGCGFAEVEIAAWLLGKVISIKLDMCWKTIINYLFIISF